MAPEHLDRILQCMIGEEIFEDDEVVFRAGSQAYKVYLLLDGEVALEIHSPARPHRILQTVAGGETLGWSWLFEPHRWTFDARAITRSRAMILDGSKIRECIDDEPELGLIVIKRIANLVVDRLHATRLQLLDLYANGT
jgi:CRP-like cAMP-binding protein